jgi:drug/metabolite transporter (DMT)-like permease
MILANKMVTMYLSSTVVISFTQILFATLTIFTIKLLKLEKVDNFEWSKVRGYLLYVFFFFASMFTNIKALSTSNIETVVVFRSCSPLTVCAIEYFFMNREFPSARSSLSLLGVVFGAILYCLSDSQLHLEGISSYGWVLAYFFMISLDMTYGKVLSSSVQMDSVWGSVYYCNTLSLVPFFLMGTYEGNFIESFSEIFSLNLTGTLVLIFSCIVGTFIG